MANTKISAMTAATAATASTVPVVQGGANRKVEMTATGAALIEAADAAAARAVLDVVAIVAQTVKTSSFSTTSATYVEVTDLDNHQVVVAGASDKVLVRAVLQVCQSAATDLLSLRLTRGGTVLAQGATAGSRTRTHAGIYQTSSGYGMATVVLEFLDTPGAGTHSYAVEVSIGGGLTAYVNRGHSDTDNAYIPRGVSTLTTTLFET